MNSADQNVIDDDINLRDLLLLLWAHKLLIMLTCGIGVIYGAYLALNADKKFTANATFMLSEKGGESKFSAINLGGDVAALAGMSGLGLSQRASVTQESFEGRNFIEKVNKKVNLEADRYFNKYNAVTQKDPFWKSKLKSLIGYQNSSTDPYQLMWHGIIKKYKENIVLDISPKQIITIKVTHESNIRASEIANSIMEMILRADKNKIINRAQDQLDYLSNALADALSELEMAQSDLKTFALENRAQPLENFVIGSLTLDELRGQLKLTISLYNAISEVKKILQKKSIDENDYLNLSKGFPIVDKVEFRRILGQSEIISSWAWPEKRIVQTVLDTLIERKKRQQLIIRESQKKAERSSDELKVYAKLKRKEKISEATYKVLIEQVKTQSMSLGYKPDTSVIYEKSSPPVYPSEPRRKIYIIYGFLSGLLIGSLLSIWFSLLNKVYYSKHSIMVNVKAKFAANARSLIRLRSKSLYDLKNTMKQKPIPILRDLSMEIHKNPSSFVVVSSLNTKLKSVELARLLASFMQIDIMKIAIIDFSRKAKVSINIDVSDTVGAFCIIENDDKVSLLQLKSDQNPIDFISQRDFFDDIDHLNKTFDLIILCADNNDSLSLTRAIQLKDVFHILLTRVKHSKVKMVSQILDIKSVQGLLHV